MEPYWNHPTLRGNLRIDLFSEPSKMLSWKMRRKFQVNDINGFGQEHRLVIQRGFREVHRNRGGAKIGHRVVFGIEDHQWHRVVHRYKMFLLRHA